MKSFILFACLISAIATANTAPVTECGKKEEALKEDSKDVEQKEAQEQK